MTDPLIVTLPQAVDLHARRTPQRLAMRCLDRLMSYAQLSARSNQLANALVELGVRRRDRVGIYMEKSLLSPVAMHGIMKAGAAYVPLDPSAPPQRIAAMIQDCGIRHLVGSDSMVRALERLRQAGPDGLCVVGVEAAHSAGYDCLPWSTIDDANAAAPPGLRIVGDDMAYIIYTSGSTGEPKGMVHTHDSSLAFSRWAAAEYGLTETDLLSNHAPLHFDLSILDFFAGAVAGCATSIFPPEYTRLPASYATLIAEQGISVLYTVPFALVQLLLRGNLDRHDFSALRWVIFGGEPMSTKHLAALMRCWPKARFDNMYGPAEVNGVTHHEVPPLTGDEPGIPIGSLGIHTEGLIVDDGDVEVPEGTPGELLVRTPSMMRGYWARPDLNQRAFFRRCPLPGVEEVFYRTGDLVRADAAGVLEFLGRKDRQVKIRGYRVELDEVESVLTQHPAVEEAAAVTRADGEGGQAIVAAVTLKDAASALAPGQLVAHCKARLPWYALPSRIATLQAFARTTTGKIDRRAVRECLLEDDALATSRE